MHAIFQALFGKRRVRSGPKERYGGNWDDEVEEDADGQDEDEEVDESWIKTGISLSLFSSKAVDFACRYGVATAQPQRCGARGERLGLNPRFEVLLGHLAAPSETKRRAHWFGLDAWRLIFPLPVLLCRPPGHSS